MSRTRWMFLSAVLLFSACGTEITSFDRYQQRINEEAYRKRFQREAAPDELTGIRVSPADSNATFANPNWKMILMTGDDSISAFDNARKKVHSLLTVAGVVESIQLSRSASQAVGGVRPTSAVNLQKAFQDLKIQDGDACILFMTSHGTPQGFYIRAQPFLSPSQLNSMVNSTCGKRPTVLLVSACYSGIFTEPMMEAPNRIILTAARKDKTSFGCSSEAVYTYWDGCLVDNLPVAHTWLELAGLIEKCIERKEAAGGFARSYPQARFGADVKNLEIKQ